MILRFSNIDFLFLQIKFLCDVPFPLTSSPNVYKVIAKAKLNGYFCVIFLLKE